jgi:hypothetical protein
LELDTGRLLAEFNTNFIFQHIDKTKDISQNYRTTVFDLVAFNKNEEPTHMFDQTSCFLEKEESGLFTVFLAPGTKQCNKLTFEDASNEKHGYHPLAVLDSSNFEDITEHFISNTKTYKDMYGGLLPKLCASGQMMSNETAHSRKQELTSIFNFGYNENRIIAISVWKICQTPDDTLNSITKSSLFNINSDIYFKEDKQIVSEKDGFTKIVILKKSTSCQKALGFVTTDFPANGAPCVPASEDDIVTLSNFVVFKEGEKETEVVVRVKKDIEIEGTECFTVQVKNVTEMQNRKRRKRSTKEEEISIEIQDLLFVDAELVYPKTEAEAEQLMLDLQKDKENTQAIYDMLEEEHTKLKNEGYVFIGWRGISPSKHWIKAPKSKSEDLADPAQVDVEDYLKHNRPDQINFVDKFYAKGKNAWQGMYIATFVDVCYGYVYEGNDKRNAKGSGQAYLPWIFRVYLKIEDIQTIGDVRMWKDGNAKTMDPDPYKTEPKQTDEYIYYGMEGPNKNDFRGYEVVLSPSVAQKAKFLLSTFTAKGYTMDDHKDFIVRPNNFVKIEAALSDNDGELYETKYFDGEDAKENIVQADNSF